MDEYYKIRTSNQNLHQKQANHSAPVLGTNGRHLASRKNRMHHLAEGSGRDKRLLANSMAGRPMRSTRDKGRSTS